MIAPLLLVLGLFPVTASASPRLRDGVDELVARLQKGFPKDRKLTIAVADFSDLQGYTDDFGRYVAERTTTRLSEKSGNLKVVERRRLLAILDEMEMGMSGLVDPTKAKQVGKVLGADALLIGTVSDVGKEIDLDARILETETANTLTGATISIKKDRPSKSLLGKGRTAPKRSKNSEAKADTNSKDEADPNTTSWQGIRFRLRSCSWSFQWDYDCYIQLENSSGDKKRLAVSPDGSYLEAKKNGKTFPIHSFRSGNSSYGPEQPLVIDLSQGEEVNFMVRYQISGASYDPVGGQDAKDAHTYGVKAKLQFIDTESQKRFVLGVK